MKKIILITILLLVLTASASAFGITGPLSVATPIKMMPGESIEFYYDLQNGVGEDDLDITVKVVGGADIASLPQGSVYTVPLRDRINLPILVKIPGDAKLGTIYDVTLSFKQFSQDINKPIQISAELYSSFVVIVGAEGTAEPTAQATTEKPVAESQEGKGINITYVLILLVIIVAWLIFRKRK